MVLDAMQDVRMRNVNSLCEAAKEGTPIETRMRADPFFMLEAMVLLAVVLY
jgi:hypothetical protein